MRKMTTREVLKHTFHLELKLLFCCFPGPEEAARMSSFQQPLLMLMGHQEIALF